MENKKTKRRGRPRKKQEENGRPLILEVNCDHENQNNAYQLLYKLSDFVLCLGAMWGFVSLITRLYYLVSDLFSFPVY